MTENELIEYLRFLYPREDAACEWKEMKNLKNSFANDIHKDVISYVSGISNMEGGHLVIGVKDGSLEIVGTDLSQVNFDSISVTYKLIELCPNLPSEGLSVSEFITSDSNKTIWIVNIPKHLPRKPVFAHRKKWQRIGDSLVELTPERENVILNESMNRYDWSAEIVDGATCEDLDPKALERALEGFCQRFPQKATEARRWPIEMFLDKAKLTKNGKITRTTLLLLGKEESVHFLNHPAEMVWRLQNSQERAASIFYPPFLLSAERLRDTIRNYQIKIFPNNAMLPAEVWKYDSRSILEALHNCILHQDYTKQERIVVTENVDKLVFKNAGSFYDGTYEDYIEGTKTPTIYRNQFLQSAMVNLKMIDSQGFGIHDMFEQQRSRYLPLPSYENSTGNHVILEMSGQVMDVAYSTTLMENTHLDLSTVFLLDRVQRNKTIPKEGRAKLRKLGLIEGKHPRIIISRRLAQITQSEADYTDKKGFDDDYYKDLILNHLRNHKQLRRNKIDQLLLNKLPGVLNDTQKRNHIDYLLKCLRKAGKIHVGKNKYWELGSTST